MIWLAHCVFLACYICAVSAGSRSPLHGRKSCVFSDIHTLAAGKSSCSSLTLSNIAVPAGQTLDLSGLSNQKVTFAGTTTFGYSSWQGPLITITGKNVVVVGAAGHVIDAQGQRWWDGKGLSGGVTKPKGILVNVDSGSVSNLSLRSMPLNGGYRLLRKSCHLS